MADQTTDRLVDRLADRLVDIALGSLSTSLYRARNLRVTTTMEDMVDFFHVLRLYRTITCITKYNIAIPKNNLYLFVSFGISHPYFLQSLLTNILLTLILHRIIPVLSFMTELFTIFARQYIMF